MKMDEKTKALIFLTNGEVDPEVLKRAENVRIEGNKLKFNVRCLLINNPRVWCKGGGVIAPKAP